MKLSAKVVGQAAIIVVETKISGTHLAHSKLLLLEAGGWHGVSVFFLKENLYFNKQPTRSTCSFVVELVCWATVISLTSPPPPPTKIPAPGIMQISKGSKELAIRSFNDKASKELRVKAI